MTLRCPARHMVEEATWLDAGAESAPSSVLHRRGYVDPTRLG